MTEKELQEKIIRLLKKNGRWVMKASAGPGVPIGTPDIISISKDGKLLAIEVKSPDNDRIATIEQLHVIKKMENQGAKCFVIKTLDDFHNFKSIEKLIDM